MLHTHLPRIVSGVLSLLQSTKLRNRVYAMEDRLDILETAIEDVERINARSSHPNTLITGICQRVREHHQQIGEHL